MRTSFAVLTLVALVGMSACSLGSDSTSAKTREQEVVDVVAEGFPLAQSALDGSAVMVEGQWSSCPGGVGHQFSGGGVLIAPQGEAASQRKTVLEALTGAGFEDVTQVEDHVSVTRDDVKLDIQEPNLLRGPTKWLLSFYGPCLRYSGDDESYVKAQNSEPARTILP